METPVLFIIFNRPETTKEVFQAIRKAKPKQLFIAADGPRPGKIGEKEKCEETRKVASAVDWPCELHTMFREENMGCGLGPVNAISWFFKYVEQGIILEDDCLPNVSFFDFCHTLLDYYKDNERVMHISGNNFQFGKRWGDQSYYFSIYTHNWGWATWRRAWEKYQFQLNDLDETWDKISARLKRQVEKDFWFHAFNELRYGKSDVWDGQWQYTVWKNDGVSVLPNKNLIKNIGFGIDATHTFQRDSRVAFMKTYEIPKIKHPRDFEINYNADQRGFNEIFLLENNFSLFERVKNKLSRVLKLKATE